MFIKYLLLMLFFDKLIKSELLVEDMKEAIPLPIESVQTNQVTEKLKVVETSHVTEKLKVVNSVESDLGIYYGDNDRPVTNDAKSIFTYLNRFGYIDHVKRALGKLKDTNSLMPKNSLHPLRDHLLNTNPKLAFEYIKSESDVTLLSAAISEFQRFFRLNVTGHVDEPTLKMMNKPRCGLKDLGEAIISPSYVTLIGGKRHQTLKLLKRSKRHALAGSRWKIGINLTYKITKYPSKFRQPSMRKIIDEQFASALKYWSDVTPLTFTRVPARTASRDVIIDIRFEKGEHGDGDPHDGNGKVLAHAFFPQYGGDAHFDDDEIWTVNSEQGSNVLMAGTHELGHALGLDHSDAPEAIMGPIYPPYRPHRKLSQDDVRAIQAIYGSRNGTLDVPNLCIDAEISAVIQIDPKSLFVFKSKYFWRIRLDDMRLDYEYPKEISTAFAPLDNDVEAVFYMPDGSIYMFDGELSYKFVELSLEDDYPKKIIDEFPSLIDNVDAAIQLDNVIYAFKGDEYWFYELNKNETEKQQPNPRKIESLFPGIPGSVDAVFRWTNAMYFFKDQEYYRINTLRIPYLPYQICVTTPPYPRKTALWWFGCH